VLVLVTISGVGLNVGEGVMPVAVTLRVMVTVGVARVSGARERAIKPAQ
jgi:hypothetical protein